MWKRKVNPHGWSSVPKRFYEENGHLNVSKGYIGSNGKRLNEWVLRQRNIYKEGNLPQDNVEQLRDIGMLFVLDEPW